MEFAGWARSGEAKSVLVRLLAPFAPHLAEELWERLGGPFSVHTQPWPELPESPAGPAEVEIVVQVDGRRRGVVAVPAAAGKGEVVAVARQQIAAVPPTPERVVYVPGRVVNFVSA
jgi:leucyl-tRNA synthetase